MCNYLLIYPLRFGGLAFVCEVFNEQIPRVLRIGQTTVFEGLFCARGVLERKDCLDSVAEGVRIAFFDRRAWLGARGGLVDRMRWVVKDGHLGVAPVQRPQSEDSSAQTMPANGVHVATLFGHRGRWTVWWRSSLSENENFRRRAGSSFCGGKVRTKLKYLQKGEYE
jgi:hypothetical protein